MRDGPQFQGGALASVRWGKAYNTRATLKITRNTRNFEDQTAAREQVYSPVSTRAGKRQHARVAHSFLHARTFLPAKGLQGITRLSF